jgi:hypothetical protein
MIGLIETLIIGGLVLLFISAALAPLESLSWWAGWYGARDALLSAPDQLEEVKERPPEPDADHYLVYLSGIGAISGDSVPPEEIAFLDTLQAHLPPGVKLVRDVFPYSVTNIGLTGNRTLGAIWRWLEQMRVKNPGALLANMINVRNLFQVAVSADPRYGPIYNFGVAQEIIRKLHHNGYPLHSTIPITLIGWSGGGQIALGATTYLVGLIGAPVRVISIGGVLADDPGLDRVTHLYHNYGSKDPVQKLGGILYAGRWPIAVQSVWNRALAEERITMHELGPIAHNGAGNYFDTEPHLPDGRSYAQVTMERILTIVEAAEVTEKEELPAARIEEKEEQV